MKGAGRPALAVACPPPRDKIYGGPGAFARFVCRLSSPGGKTMKKNHSPLSPLLLAAVIAAWAAWAPAPARGGEAVSHLEELENMDPAAKE